MNSQNKISCSGIPYRQGFIEVQSNIHGGYVNLEAWNINPEVELKGIDMSCSTIKDCDFTGNIEMELDLEAAKILVEVLNKAIAEVEAGKIA